MKILELMIMYVYNVKMDLFDILKNFKPLYLILLILIWNELLYLLIQVLGVYQWMILKLLEIMVQKLKIVIIIIK